MEDAVLGHLNTLVAGLARPAPSPDACSHLETVAKDLRQLVENILDSRSELRRPAELVGKLVDLSQCMVQLNRALAQWDWQGLAATARGSSSVRRLGAACLQLSSAATAFDAACFLGIWLELGRSDTLRVAQGAQLLLQAGRGALAALAARQGTLARADVAAAANERFVLACLMDTQLRAMNTALCMLAAGEAGPAFAATTAQPAVYLPWLGTVASVLLGCHGAEEQTSEMARFAFVYAAFHLAGLQPSYGRHAVQLTSSPAVQRAVAAALLTCSLPTLAAGVCSHFEAGSAGAGLAEADEGRQAGSSSQQAADGGGGGGSDTSSSSSTGATRTDILLRTFAHLARVVQSCALATALPGAVSRAGGMAVAPQLVRVVKALPLHLPPGSSASLAARLWRAHVAAAQLLAAVCEAGAAAHMEGASSSGGHQADRAGTAADQLQAAAAQAVAWEVLAAWPEMLATLSAACKPSEEGGDSPPPAPPGTAAKLCASYAKILHWLMTVRGMGSKAGVEMWAAAAQAGLRSLPQLAALAEGTAEEQAAACELAEATVGLLWLDRGAVTKAWVESKAAALLSAPVQADVQAEVQAGAAVQLAGLTQQLWGLHSTSCATIHWLRQDSQRAQRLLPEFLSSGSGSWTRLLTGMRNVFFTAVTSEEGGAVDLPPSRQQQLLALSASHLEAVLAAVEAGALQAAADASDADLLEAAVGLALDLAFVVHRGWQAMVATDSAGNKLLSSALALVLDKRQQRPEKVLSTLMVVFGALTRQVSTTPALALRLASSGVLARILDAARLAGSSGMVEVYIAQFIAVKAMLLQLGTDILASLIGWELQALISVSQGSASNGSSSSGTASNANVASGTAGPAATASTLRQWLELAVTELAEAEARAQQRSAAAAAGPGRPAAELAEAWAPVLEPCCALAVLLEQSRQQTAAAEAAQLQLAQGAAARSCAYLRCANLALQGGPAAGQGVGCKRCSSCRAVRYCSTACAHADWRAPAKGSVAGGHRRVCKALAAAAEQAAA